MTEETTPANIAATNYLPAVIVSLVISILSMATYHYATASYRQHIAVVDLATVYSEKEALFTKSIMKEGVTTEEKAAALAEAQAFAKTLSKSLDEIAAECNCIVLMANAVAGHQAIEDLTPELRKKVGL